MLADIKRAKIVITNYHAFKLRERIELSKGGRSLLQGRGEALNTLETEGQMLQRVMPDLMSLENVLVLNDEAHHCYREKPGAEEVSDLKGDDKEEAENTTRPRASGSPAWNPSTTSPKSRGSSISRPRRSSSAAPGMAKALCFPGP
jgi:hypothetical protein